MSLKQIWVNFYVYSQAWPARGSIFMHLAHGR